MALEPGDTAPDFTLPDQNGEPVTLSSLKGKTVVLYFYPKADTPGCTTQACGVRDHSADYEQAGAVVVGVGPDLVGDDVAGVFVKVEGAVQAATPRSTMAPPTDGISKCMLPSRRVVSTWRLSPL